MWANRYISGEPMGLTALAVEHTIKVEGVVDEGQLKVAVTTVVG